MPCKSACNRPLFLFLLAVWGRAVQNRDPASRRVPGGRHSGPVAVLRPFRALRPIPSLADRVAAPPYDVVDTEEARLFAAGNPHSYLHVSRPEIDLPPGTDPHTDPVHERGRRALAEFVEQGVLVPDPGESLYVYRQQTDTMSQVGLVGCASVDDYLEGVIAVHERTRPDKEDDRTRHIEVLDAHDEPVFLLSRSNATISAVIDEVVATPPVCEVNADGVLNQLWIVEDAERLGKLAAAFASLDRLYVADGHHRSAAAARLCQKRRKEQAEDGVVPDGKGTVAAHEVFLSVVFGEDQVRVMAYNRVVRDLAGRTPQELLERLGETFTVERAPGAVLPAGRHEFGMYLDGGWHRLALRPGFVDESDDLARLDVAVLQDRVLAPLLRITDPRTDERISFVGGARGTEELERLVDSGAFAVAFNLYPTSVAELMAVSDRGEVMPPKSTWFEPKLRSGLFLHPLTTP
ncbi:MAG: hypothetical protein QG608_94 [Actinomycetota bacterium]|nr:hypothetical protein [Actinomycetota bacterium]